MTIAGLILDILLITMLGVMIYYVMRLHNRLEVIRSGRNDLESLLRDLVVSTANAERSLMELRQHAGDLSQTLQKQVAGASRTREELEFLLGAADKAADTLMERIGTARGTTSASTTMSMPETPVSLSAAAVVERAAMRPRLEPELTATRDSAPAATPTSREAAENDLLRAIEKLR